MFGPRESFIRAWVSSEKPSICDAVGSRLRWQWSDIDREKRSTEDGALRYAEAYVCWIRHRAADRHGLGSSLRVAREPVHHWAGQTEAVVKTVQENVVVYGVECSRQVEEDERSAMAFIGGEKHIVAETKEGRFRGVVLAVGRLPVRQ